MYSRLEKNETQLTYYDSGIGTYVKEGNSWRRLKQSVAHTWDMAVAWYVHRIDIFLLRTYYLLRNLKRIILDAYRWLSENYKDGDLIFLFGEHLFQELPCVALFSDNFPQDSRVARIKYVLSAE